MSKKIRVAILFGGKSAEHEVSLQSAKNIIEAIDKDTYDVVLVGIDKKGRWLLNDQSQYLLHADNPKLISLNDSHKDLAVMPGSEKQLIAAFSPETKQTVISSEVKDIMRQQKKQGLSTSFAQSNDSTDAIGKIDVVFPVLHGTYGEDGTMQGLLKMLDIPFVGAGVLGSAIGMDKDVMKRLFRDAGIPVAKFLTVHRNKLPTFATVKKELGLPVFIKPANLGSSVGVHKVGNEKEFESAIQDAFLYDNKVLIESCIKGREVECAVLGNEKPVASVPGEIVPHHEFYSYEAKYIDEHGAGLIIPADLPEETITKVQALAIKAFTTLCCEGMARVDMFLTDDGEVYLNEINTIPGFTKISMYPKLWEASGLTYSALIDKLIQLALERHERDKKLKTSFA